MSARGLITEHMDLWTDAVSQKSTRGRGSNGKVELTGIKKLRELILELAVRGKLVGQKSTEEPASELLKKLILSKKTQKKDPLSPNNELIPDANLPNGWVTFRLGDFLEFQYGKSLPAKSRDNSGCIEVYGSNGVVGFHSEALTKAPCVVIGRKGSAGALNKAMKPSWTTDVAYYLKPPEGFDFEFTFLLLQSLRLDRLGKGIKPGVNRNEAYALTAALPPLQEQHRIVEKVDELMALCDRLEQQTGDQLEAHETLVDTLLGTLTQSENATELADNWSRLAAHFDTLFTTEQSIDKLKQTILQLAVMGRLVEQDAGNEPTAQLLERVSSEKQRLVKSKVLKPTKSLAPVDISVLPSIPESWSWVNLGDIISVMDAGWSPACPPRPATPDTWGVLKTTAVQVMKYQEFENKQLPDNKAPKKQYEVRSGDILITRAGPKNRVGISCVVKETRDKLMISDKIIRFHLIETGLSEEYICLCLNAGETYSYLEQAKSGMAESQMNISQDKLKAAPLPLCSTNEQHRIVEKVDELTALCDQLKERLNQASETRCQLAEAVVEGALSE